MEETKELTVGAEKPPAKRGGKRAITKYIEKAIAQRAPALVDKTMDALERRLEANDLSAVTIVSKILGFAGDSPSTVINNNINNANISTAGRSRSMSFERILQLREEEDARIRAERLNSDVQDAEFEDV